MRQDLQKLQRIASQMMGKFQVMERARRGKIDVSDTESYMDELGRQVREELSRWTPERVGAIAWLGQGEGEPATDETIPQAPTRTSLRAMHNSAHWLGSYQSGRSLVLMIATTTIVAAIKDIVDSRANTPSGAEWMDDHRVRDTVIAINKGG